MIQYTVECRMINPKGKTVTKATKVKARDNDEAKAKARQVYWGRGNRSVEALVAV